MKVLVATSLGLLLLGLGATSGFGDTERRPFRSGILKLDQELDATKPIGPSYVPGWAWVENRLVGEFEDQWVGAADLSTMRHHWWFRAEHPLAAPIAAFGSTVVIGTRDGSVLKLDAVTGNLMWQSKAQLDSFSERRFYLTGETLFALTAGQVLYAIEYASGRILWVYDAGFPEELTIEGGVAPVVYKGTVLFGTASGDIHAVSLDSGKLIWKENLAVSPDRFRGVTGELVVQDSRLIYARHDGKVGAFDLEASDHTKIWVHDTGPITTSTYRDGRFYVGTATGDLIVYETVSGRVVWQSQIYAPLGFIHVGEQAVYVVGSNGRVVAVDTSDGKTLWHDDVGGEVSSPPFIIARTLYVPTGLKVLYGFRLASQE